MEQAFRFRLMIRDLFNLADGRRVLVGPVQGGENILIKPGPTEVIVNDRVVATVNIEPEMIPQRSNPLEYHDWRAVSTRDDPGISKELVATGACRLEGAMTVVGHRHLLGIDSPPADYVPDNMTLGPRLPAGWDGDAWTRPDGRGSFLRAWNKETGRFAIGVGAKYEEARHKLLEEVRLGNKRVVISATESAAK